MLIAPRKMPEPFRLKNAKMWYFCYWEGDKRIYKSAEETQVLSIESMAKD